MDTTAGDVMTTDLVTLKPETTAEEAIRTLLQHRISGAPVTGSDGKLLGIVSEYQLLAIVYDESFKQRPVEDLMTKEVITVEASTPLPEISSLFIMHRIRRLPVLKEGELVGQISRRDIIRCAIDEREAVAPDGMR